MTLQVPFDQFVPTVRRLLGSSPAFLCHQERGTLVTAADPARHLVVTSINRETLDKTREKLKVNGLESFEGVWREGEEISPLEEGSPVPYVAAISYKTDTDMPGVWIDAFEELPTQVMALRSLYEEFRSTGELSDEISFEEFVRLANPNVVIVSPDELSSYMRQKEERRPETPE